jgi:hypothetical protein
MQSEGLKVMWLRHALLGVLVRKNRSAEGMQRGVVVGVVEVPVSINDEFQRGVAEAVEGLFELGPSRGNERVDDELAVGAVQHDHISARTGEEREVVREFLCLEGNGGHLRAKAGNRIGGRGAGLLGMGRGGGVKERRRKKLREERAAGEHGGVA